MTTPAEIPGYNLTTLPDLSNLGSQRSYRIRGESLGERFARKQADAVRPVDLSNLRNLSPSRNSNAPRPIPTGNAPNVPNPARPTTSTAPVTRNATAPTAILEPPRPPTAPARIPLPTSGSIPRFVRSVAPGIGLSAASAAGDFIQGRLDDANEQLGDMLPENLEPVWDRLAGPNGALEQWLTPPNLAGAREASRLSNDVPRLLNGLPARSLSGNIAQQLVCSIFGVGCPTTEPGGVPNLGSPGAAPPFYGGQTPGRVYQVMVQYEVKQNGSTIDTDTRPIIASGPIRGVRALLDNEAPGTSYQVQVLVDPSTNGGVDFINVTAGSGGGPYEASQAIVGIIPISGDPDTGGNPSPEPGASPRPATTPPLVNRPISPPANAPQLPSTGVPNPSTTPLNPPVTAPPDTATPDPFAPFRNPDPLALLPMLGLAPFLAPSGGSFFNPSGALQGGDRNKAPTKTGDVPTPTCRYDSSNIAGRVDAANATLNLVQLFMEQQMMSKLNTLDAKLGPQIPGGGIGNFIKKTWNFLQVDRVLSVLTWIGVLHNAYMLSNGLAQTLFSAISNILDVFGVEDADGGALDVGAIVSGWTDAFFKRIFGVETVNGIKEGWKKFNRIYQAAANIVWSIQSITFSMVEMLEVISNYTGRIGNALRKAGGVLENAYNWMNPNANYTNNRFFNALNNTQEAVEAIDQIASETLSIQETGAELYNQKQEFDTAKNEAEQFIGNQQSESKSESTKPNVTINPSDELKAES